MIFENVTLAVILATLLITKLVESTGDKGAKPLVAPPIPQQVGDQLALPGGSEETGQSLHESSARESTPPVTVKVADPVAKQLQRDSF